MEYEKFVSIIRANIKLNYIPNNMVSVYTLSSLTGIRQFVIRDFMKITKFRGVDYVMKKDILNIIR